jgi:hypothetical protein
VGRRDWEQRVWRNYRHIRNLYIRVRSGLLSASLQAPALALIGRACPVGTFALSDGSIYDRRIESTVQAGGQSCFDCMQSCSFPSCFC